VPTGTWELYAGVVDALIPGEPRRVRELRPSDLQTQTYRRGSGFCVTWVTHGDGVPMRLDPVAREAVLPGTAGFLTGLACALVR
jgi:hypothetical protein